MKTTRELFDEKVKRESDCVDSDAYPNEVYEDAMTSTKEMLLMMDEALEKMNVWVQIDSIPSTISIQARAKFRAWLEG